MFFLTLFLWVAAFLINEFLAPKPKSENARPAHLGDFSFPTATEGRVVPIIWGTVKISGPNVVWYGDLQAKKIKKSVKTGIFSTTTITQGYKYYVGIQFALCRGTVDLLKRIWVDDKVVFDGSLGDSTFDINQPTLFGGSSLGNGGLVGTFRFHRGTRTQLANSYLSQAPPDFLWFDDFSKGQPNDALLQFKKSEANEYYSVSNNGNSGTFGPSTSLDTLSSNIRTLSGNTEGVHARSAYVGGSPGDTNLYCCLLINSGRPRLRDNISITMDFFAKDPSANDGGAHRIWMGCRVDDGVTPNSGHGLFLVVEDQNHITIQIMSPSTSGAYVTSKTLSVSNGDFSVLTAKHNAEMRLDGNQITVLVDGVMVAQYLDSRVTTIDESFQGFCVGMEGNLNTDFVSGNFQNAGIYNFGIDSTLRSHSSTVPAYRGICHGVYEKGYIGNSTTISPWAFELQRLNAVNDLGLSLTGGKHIIRGNDLNPMCMLYEILTDPDWGLGFTDSQIDLTNLRAAADVLYNENNGISFVLDSPIEVADLLKEIERQVDGFIYVDRSTGKWKITLARADYELEDLSVANEANVLEVSDFTRGAWEETSNNVRVEFANRSNGYAVGYGSAQDMANVMIQQNVVITVQQKYPGVKDKKLANNIAWRDLRTFAYPLAKATLVTDRSFSSFNPGDVFLWADARRGISGMPMRVQRIDLGKLDDSKLTINAVQDVFSTDEPSFADPDDTSWVVPNDSLPVNIEDGDRIFFEAPRKFCTLATVNAGHFDRVWIGARYENDRATRFDIWSSDAGSAYSLAGSVEGFLAAGELVSALDASTIQGSTTFDISPTPDNIADLVANLESATSAEIGLQLANLILIDDEIIGFTDFSNDGSTVTFSNAYRGLLDTVPAKHASGARVWLICTNGSLTDVSFTPASTVALKLLPENSRGSLDIGIASPTSITLNHRVLRPYPPVELLLNNVRWDDTVSADVNGAGGGIGLVFSEPFSYSNGELGAVSGGAWAQFDDALGTTSTKIQVSGSACVLPIPVTGIDQINMTLTGGLTYDLETGYSFEAVVTLYPSGSGTGTSIFGVDIEGNETIRYTTGPTFSLAVYDVNGDFELDFGPRGSTFTPGVDIFQDLITGITAGVPFTLRVEITAGTGSGRFAKVFIDNVQKGGFDCPIPAQTGVTSFVCVLGTDQSATSATKVDDISISAIIATSDTKGITLDFTRRDFRNTNEILALDETNLPGDFPTANTTQYAADVYNDPAGTNTFLFTTDWVTGADGIFIKRADLTRLASGVPSDLRVKIRTRHVNGGTWEAGQTLDWDFSLTSTDYSGGTYVGLKSVNQASNDFTVSHTGSYKVTIGTAFTAGGVEYQVNHGTWFALFSTGVRQGTFSAASGDTVNIRHTQTGSSGHFTGFDITDLTDGNVKAFGDFSY